MQQRTKFKRQKSLLMIILTLVLLGGSPSVSAWWGGWDWFCIFFCDDDDGNIVYIPPPLEETIEETAGDILEYYTENPWMLPVTQLITHLSFPIHLVEQSGRFNVPENERIAICADTGGQYMDDISVSRCSNGIAVIDPQYYGPQSQQCVGGRGYDYEKACLYEDPQGQYYWDDGPSIPAPADVALRATLADTDGRYAVLFWKAGQLHDYCYHHGAAQYGYTRKYCDDEFRAVMYDICEQEWGEWWESFEQLQCEAAASIMYEGVVVAGSDAYAATNTMVDYLHRDELPVMAPQVDELLISVVVSATTSILLL